MTRRITGDKLREIRRRMYADDPTCARCGRLLTSGVDWQSDHIIPLFKGGEDTEENRQNLCTPCHKIKSAEDMGHKPRREIGLDGWPIEG